MGEIINILIVWVLINAFLGVFVIFNTYLNYKFIKHRIRLDRKKELMDDRAYETWLNSLGDRR